MKIPVILLNYNSSSDCKKCISFLKRQQGVELEIVVVDNCSRQNEVEQLRQLCSQEDCTLIENHENRGYNAGNNIGLRYAVSKGYEYALIANPDMEFPQTNYIASLMEAMYQDPNIVVVGSDIVGVNGERQNPWKFSTPWDELAFATNFTKKFRKKRTVMPPQNNYCDIVSGCCLLVRLNFIKEIGYFDEHVFLYCEEVILGRQVQQNNKKSYYVHSVQAIHRHVEKAKGSFIKRHQIFWQSRWYYIKNYSGYNKISIWLIYILREVYYKLKVLLLRIKGVK